MPRIGRFLAFGKRFSACPETGWFVPLCPFLTGRGVARQHAGAAAHAQTGSLVPRYVTGMKWGKRKDLDMDRLPK